MLHEANLLEGWITNIRYRSMRLGGGGATLGLVENATENTDFVRVVVNLLGGGK